ncbi:Cof-type HAD-IIB family hydrolase [Mycoplasmatota bacterium]|nr:Cof-type HAD-IIB family hydrolase [Mycoplasmatota bacterium]
MNKKLVFFDIDGTLYDYKNDHIPKSTIEALKQLSEKDNVEIAIATGRACFLIDKVKEVIEYFDAFIFLNGLHIMYKGEEIYKQTIDSESINKIKKTLIDRKLIYGYFNSKEEYISQVNENIKKDFDSVNLIPPPVKEVFNDDEVMQVYFFGNDDDFKHIQEHNPDFKVVAWNDNGADILPKEISKEFGIRKLAEKLNYDLEDVFAFGDALNDIEMIRVAGVGIAMGNAREELKEVSDYVTDDIQEDGIYNALKHFKLI